jgi:methyltransferase family protein
MNISANLNLSRYEWADQCLQEFLPRAPSPIVNDIGAGDGRMRVACEAAGGHWQGFDLVPQCPEIRSWNLDDPAASGLRSAGVILMLDVLEHLGNPWLGMQHLAQTLLPEGFLVVTTPNPRWSRSRCYSLARGCPICFTQSDLDGNHHVFPVWPHIMERLLLDTGFSIERYITLDGRTGWPRRPYNLRYPLRCAFAALNMAIERLDATACGMSYGIVGRKNKR